ncbi:hypothetical protein BH20ACT2_BH20ACT2_01720 [soil metagenome]
MTGDRVLRAPLVIEYPFTRTTGPVVGAFLTGLREQVVLGAKLADGRVVVPPIEFDPGSGDDIAELVEVGQAGEVLTWAWMAEPRRDQPLDRPFAWALVRLDGADTAMLHAVDAGEESAMATGMRVRVRWRDEREGHICDIACFEPVADGGAS